MISRIHSLKVTLSARKSPLCHQSFRYYKPSKSIHTNSPIYNNPSITPNISKLEFYQRMTLSTNTLPNEKSEKLLEQNSFSLEYKRCQDMPTLSQVMQHYAWPIHSKLQGLYIDGRFQEPSSEVILESYNPSTGECIAQISGGQREDINKAVAALHLSSLKWKEIPAPKRGQFLAKLKDVLESEKTYLGALISYEMGKIYSEGLGEVQEVLDMCDYVIGLSRSFSGSTFPSERPNHILMEQWQPLGVIGVITAFNFPLAVFGWNALVALVTGNTVLWKPAPSTSLIAIAFTQLLDRVTTECQLPSVVSLVCGDRLTGETLVNHKNIPLLSFTGSTAVGRHVGVQIARRFGRSLLECGGNNAAIIMPDADLDSALSSIFFSAVGTCGQRCTSLRRLYLHKDIYSAFVERLVQLYKSRLLVGPAWHPDTICGPLHSQGALQLFQDTVNKIVGQGGKVLVGGRLAKDALSTNASSFIKLESEPVSLPKGRPSTVGSSNDFVPYGKSADVPMQGYGYLLTGNYVFPGVSVDLPRDASLLKEESFVPILHIQSFSTFEEAVQLNNDVSQGLSSALFTRDPTLIFRWIGPHGSDCGLINVNTPTSGAEIGAAFGGNKETGGGREAGSDAWKSYMRRSTCTIHYAPIGAPLHLSQGLKPLD